MMNKAILVGCLALFGASEAAARPVSYPGGWTVMQKNSGVQSSIHVHYSPTAKDSIGWYTETNWKQDYTYSGLQYNRLVKRWNDVGSQGNLYVKSSSGVAEGFGANTRDIAGFVGIAADWETRRFFTSYEITGLYLGDTTSVRQSARIGFAPYIGDYGDIHTWLMLEAFDDPKADTPLTLKPILRIFRNVQLLELGYEPTEENVTLNWVVRF